MNHPDLPMRTASEQFTFSLMRPFFHVAWIWAAASKAVISYQLWGKPGVLKALVVFGAFWFLSICSLYSLARVVAMILDLGLVSQEKRTPLLIRASYWGLFKLVCVGILITALNLVSESASPYFRVAVSLGISTVCVVPLVGGYFWSRRVVEHA